MKKTTTLFSFAGTIIVSAAVIWGCGDDDDTVAPKADSGTSSGDTGTSSGSSGADTGASSGDAGNKPPVLGAQIDRFGRPAINTAANNVFNPDSASAGTAKDGYNADGVQTGWVAKYLGEAEKNLAIYDGLDQTCGNQTFANADAAAPNQADRYKTLASVLTDDRQWVNTAGTCGSFTATNGYLAVELNATGTANTDCGGRRLPVDVIDVTYGVVAAPGVTDGIGAIEAKTNGTAFPYLAAP